MPDHLTRDAKLVEMLNEAYSKERQLELSLKSHIEITTRPDYKRRLREHLKETKSHASSLAARIKQLGGKAETVSLPGPEGASKAAQSLQEVVGKAKAAAQGPMHLAKGSGEQARMLHNARAEYRDEAEEIATYTAIDGLATSVGDKKTAKLARDIRRDEERMAQFIVELLPQLATDVAHDEIPVSEIAGPAARRTSSGSGRTRSAAGKGSRSAPRKKTSNTKQSRNAKQSRRTSKSA